MSSDLGSDQVYYSTSIYEGTKIFPPNSHCDVRTLIDNYRVRPDATHAAHYLIYSTEPVPPLVGARSWFLGTGPGRAPSSRAGFTFPD